MPPRPACHSIKQQQPRHSSPPSWTPILKPCSLESLASSHPHTRTARPQHAPETNSTSPSTFWCCNLPQAALPLSLIDAIYIPDPLHVLTFSIILHFISQSYSFSSSSSDPVSPSCPGTYCVL
ncbi:hypothetical protein E2C01_086498 [Portunus trituberculatus]|uniref:Uncharacterized protein n=1 Tax=Portunus trituberculatus TaxID=210409 RepID=A0A5B7J405_PORTR|nr:hypothetical protein [Portunus trituberculatus]